MNASDAVVKLIDFGCALIDDGNGHDAGERTADDCNNTSPTTDEQQQHLAVGKTIAYCPPEALSGKGSGKNPQAADMWALGEYRFVAGRSSRSITTLTFLINPRSDLVHHVDR